jgi:hypothetical protein
VRIIGSPVAVPEIEGEVAVVGPDLKIVNRGRVVPEFLEAGVDTPDQSAAVEDGDIEA